MTREPEISVILRSIVYVGFFYMYIYIHIYNSFGSANCYTVGIMSTNTYFFCVYKCVWAYDYCYSTICEIAPRLERYERAQRVNEWIGENVRVSKRKRDRASRAHMYMLTGRLAWTKKPTKITYRQMYMIGKKRFATHGIRSHSPDHLYIDCIWTDPDRSFSATVSQSVNNHKFSRRFRVFAFTETLSRLLWEWSRAYKCSSISIPRKCVHLFIF